MTAYYSKASLAGLVLACLCSAASDAATPSISPKLTIVDHANMVAATQVKAWLDARDAAGPAYTGGPAWKKFMALIHDEIKSMGLVAITDHAFPYTRWYT